jgi:hypothetical protein
MVGATCRRGLPIRKPPDATAPFKDGSARFGKIGVDEMGGEPMRWIYRSARRTIIAATLLASTPLAAGAQDFAKLSCPLLAELRMEMLIRFGFCPTDRYYLQLYQDVVPQCNSELPEFQVEELILSGRAKNVITGEAPQPEEIARLKDLLEQLRRRKCDF